MESGNAMFGQQMDEGMPVIHAFHKEHPHDTAYLPRLNVGVDDDLQIFLARQHSHNLLWLVVMPPQTDEETLFLASLPGGAFKRPETIKAVRSGEDLHVELGRRLENQPPHVRLHAVMQAALYFIYQRQSILQGLLEPDCPA